MPVAIRDPGGGDSRIPSTGNPNLYNSSQLLASDQKIASDLGIPVNQLSPQAISDYQAEQAARSGGTWEQVFMNKILPVAAVSLATMGIGSSVAPALAGTLGTTGSAIAGGALQGAAAGAGTAGLTGGKIGKGALTGALTGGVTGGLSQLASPVTQSITNAGINPTVANAITRGTIGAGVGALGSQLTGGKASNGAIAGGIGGAAAGAVGSLSGSPVVGNAAGTIAGTLAGKYLTSPSAPSAPAMPVGAPAMPGMPGATPQGVPALPGAGGTPNTTGLGYAPRQQTNYSNIDFSKYGQGPEASFYTSNANPNPYPQNIGSYSGYGQKPVMRTTQSGVTPQNST